MGLTSEPFVCVPLLPPLVCIDPLLSLRTVICTSKTTCPLRMRHICSLISLVWPYILNILAAFFKLQNHTPLSQEGPFRFLNRHIG